MSNEIGPNEFNVNQHTDPNWNREPGIVIVPGSNYANEVAKFEQFHSQYTAGTQPGRPYTYRPFPKMVYRAERYNGAPACMAAAPDPLAFRDPREFDRAEAMAAKFNENCQRIVKDDREYQKAMEEGYRESLAEAIERLVAKDANTSLDTAHRNYEDRNMSEMAKREIAAIEAESGGDPVPEIPESPRRGPGRPRKSVA